LLCRCAHENTYLVVIQKPYFCIEAWRSSMNVVPNIYADIRSGT
jgi:hypothetical protein